MYRLEILYTTGSTLIKRFKSRRKALVFAQEEGDHVWEYNIIKEPNNKNRKSFDE